jgi:hypothetical protein
VGNRNAHARRHFVEATLNFPQECRFVLETLGEVYGYDAQAEELGLSPEERLRCHQEHNGPEIGKLRACLRAQFDERIVEPYLRIERHQSPRLPYRAAETLHRVGRLDEKCT